MPRAAVSIGYMDNLHSDEVAEVLAFTTSPAEGNYRSPTERALIFGWLAAQASFLAVILLKIEWEIVWQHPPHTWLQYLLQPTWERSLPPLVGPFDHPLGIFLITFGATVFALRAGQLGHHLPRWKQWLVLCVVGGFIEGVMLLSQFVLIFAIVMGSNCSLRFTVD
ncbi:MAG TPA: hypothetical protein VF607_10895 [Verrucomicrobiae bacterium]